jgi:hypothetical protein
MRATILDQPLIAVATGHVEKVDRDHGHDLPIRPLDIVHGKERLDESNIRFDDADPVVRPQRTGTPSTPFAARRSQLSRAATPVREPAQAAPKDAVL